MSKLTNRHKTKTARNKTAKATSRRRFLKGAAVAAAGAAMAFPEISRALPQEPYLHPSTRP